MTPEEVRLVRLERLFEALLASPRLKRVEVDSVGGVTFELEPVGAQALEPPTVEMLKELRARTGASLVDCKAALLACAGDFEKAAEHIRVKGFA